MVRFFICKSGCVHRPVFWYAYAARVVQRRLYATELEKATHQMGVYPDISMLSNLSGLEYLHIGSGAGVQSIDPIVALKKLVALSVENFQRIRDYSALSSLAGLESLSIDGDGLGPQYIHVDSLSFLERMPQLRFFSFLTARLQSKDYTPLLHLVNLEHLTLRSCRAVKNLYAELMKLPKLKYGLLAKNPDLYR